MDRDRADIAAELDELIESLPDGFMAFDRDWRITHMNRATEHDGGVDRAQVIGKIYWDAFPNVGGSPFEEALRRAMRDRVPTQAEHFYESKGRWFSLQSRPLAGGGLATYVRDTTDRRKAEEETRLLARERDELLSRLQEQFQRLPLACIVTDRYMRIIDLNPAAERVFEYTRDELLGQDCFAMLVPPQARIAVADLVRRAGEGLLEGHVINDNITKSGRIITCKWNSSLLRDHDGRVTGILGMAEDITAHTDADRRLRQSESMLAEAQRITRLGSWSWDLVTDKRTWSDELYRLFGLEPDGSASREQLAARVHPDDRERFWSRIAQARRDHQRLEILWRCVRPDGEIRSMHSIVHVEVDAAGNAIRMFGTAHDVTEREALLASERHAREEAERAARLRDDFLATLSHELRTPLSAIISWADLIRTAPADAARVERGLEIIARNARTQAQLVGDLLDLSRIVSGKLRLEIQRVAVLEIVEAAVEAMRPSAEARGIALKLLIEPISQPVHGDASRLQQVIWNLLSNAVKFTPRGGHVQVVVARVDSELEISVSDDGQGIDPAFLPHVFGRFRQADASSAREHGGLGIGLALVKELVELHGGTVIARSEGIGRGASFVVRVPIAIPKAADGDVRVPPRVATAMALLDGTMPRLTGVRVLVVDDEPDGLEVIRQLLTDQDAEVTAVRSVDEALGALDTQSFDVLLSDIGMPRRDGYELISEVRMRGLRLPAAALTAFARSEDRTRVLVSGFQAYIAKPLEAAELIATVASLSGR